MPLVLSNNLISRELDREVGQYVQYRGTDNEGFRQSILFFNSYSYLTVINNNKIGRAHV